MASAVFNPFMYYYILTTVLSCRNYYSFIFKHLRELNLRGVDNIPRFVLIVAELGFELNFFYSKDSPYTLSIEKRKIL